ncbi:MAG: 50S ribosomal protein L31e [Methanobacteriota archaeon]|nr:MAG: 50S ribosomal protein L31e [Euryarchaeota archaeon]
MAEQEEERIFVVPLRAAWAAARTDRTARAVKAIREHVKRHLKPDRIFIDDVLNEFLWRRGREHPPRRIRIKAIKFEDGSAVVSLPED